MSDHVTPPPEPGFVGRRVDPTVAREVASEYIDAPSFGHRRHVRAAYAPLVMESDRLFEQITSPHRPHRVRIMFTTCPTPYADAHELIASVRDHRVLEVTTTAAEPDRRHPLMGNEAGGQHSVRWTTGDLAEPKAILLDPRLVRRSRESGDPTRASGTR